MAFYFVGRARREPRLAWTGLTTGILTGSVLGFGRMLQGAHFLTHTLWAALVCWTVIAALYALTLRPAAGATKYPRRKWRPARRDRARWCDRHDFRMGCHRAV